MEAEKMTRKNEESIIVNLKKDVFNIIRTTILDKSIKRVWFIKRGLC